MPWAGASYRGGAATGQIIHDGWGRKARRTFGGGTEVYIYTVWGQVMASYKTGPGWTTYVLADGRRVGSADQGDGFSYFHADRLGSTRAITNSAQQVAWSGDYLPFGSEINSAGSGDNFRFTGQELEPNLGIYDYGARYYDPVLRRFLQIDSFQGSPNDPRTLNRYSYVNNNPTNLVDPTGHCGRASEKDIFGDIGCDSTFMNTQFAMFQSLASESVNDAIERWRRLGGIVFDEVVSTAIREVVSTAIRPQNVDMSLRATLVFGLPYNEFQMPKAPPTVPGVQIVGPSPNQHVLRNSPSREQQALNEERNKANAFLDQLKEDAEREGIPFRDPRDPWQARAFDADFRVFINFARGASPLLPGASRSPIPGGTVGWPYPLPMPEYGYYRR